MNKKLIKQTILLFLFIFSGSVISAYTQNNKSFFKAVKQGNAQKVEQMIKNESIDIDALDDKEYTPLYYAVNKNKLETAKLLIKNGANINYACSRCEGAGYLHIATWNNSVEIARLLIDNNIKVDIQDVKGQTPLHHSVMSDYKTLIKLYCKSGANPNIKDNEGLSAIDWAEKLMQKDNAALLKKYSDDK